MGDLFLRMLNERFFDCNIGNSVELPSIGRDRYSKRSSAWRGRPVMTEEEREKYSSRVRTHFNSELNRILRPRGIFFSHTSGFRLDSSFHVIAHDEPFYLSQK